VKFEYAYEIVESEYNLKNKTKKEEFLNTFEDSDTGINISLIEFKSKE
jgi:hypothetical protein